MSTVIPFSDTPVNAGTPTIAPLRNVAALSELIQRVQNRHHALPGMACFHGFSGYGKSCAAIYAANKWRAYHVQVKSVWTRKKLARSILQEMGVNNAAATVADMIDQIGEQLSLSQRPLLIDEADILVKRGMIEVVRDIYESSRSTIILIGEENLPHALRRWERVHGRMLDWVPAQPVSEADTRHLARLYCADIELDDALIATLTRVASGSVRRVAVNLDRARERASILAADKLTLADFPESGMFTGLAPVGRSL